MREISIMPTPDEVPAAERLFIRLSQAIEAATDAQRIEMFTDNQFRLLREDMLGDIRGYPGKNCRISWAPKRLHTTRASLLKIWSRRKAVLDWMLAEIENQVGKIVFILAGYTKLMEKVFRTQPWPPKSDSLQIAFHGLRG
jgi:hypothetical protein